MRASPPWFVSFVRTDFFLTISEMSERAAMDNETLSAVKILLKQTEDFQNSLMQFYETNCASQKQTNQKKKTLKMKKGSNSKHLRAPPSQKVARRPSQMPLQKEVQSAVPQDAVKFAGIEETCVDMVEERPEATEPTLSVEDEPNSEVTVSEELGMKTLENREDVSMVYDVVDYNEIIAPPATPVTLKWLSMVAKV